jgi:hypothetical protein
MRQENLFSRPGTKHKNIWQFQEPLVIDPLKMSEVRFANQILNLEGQAFSHTALRMPRWVFYDCAVIPGVVCGFAKKTKSLTKNEIKALKPDLKLEWTPISLFIIIPTVRQGEWIAHNLCSMNSLVKNEADELYALGFLTKAFGLWYANVEILCGMFQWGSPAIKLHSHYGPFQILTAYTPVHTYPTTMTYRALIDTRYWLSFFTGGDGVDLSLYKDTGLKVDPKKVTSLKALQTQIEAGRGPFYLRPDEVRTNYKKPMGVWHFEKS